MADISKIKTLDGTTYDLKDTEARKNISVLNQVTTYEQKSGSIANFEAFVANMPIKSIIAQIEPVQEGTGDPSPANVRLISGWTGAEILRTGINIWDKEWENGSISSATGEELANSNLIRTKGYISVRPGTIYALIKPVSSVHGIAFYNANKVFISYYICNNSALLEQITTPDNCYYMRFRCITTYGKIYNNDISINYPETDTIYHSYTGNQISITFPETIYGGEHNVIDGNLSKTYNMVDMSSLNWTLDNTTLSVPVFKVQISNKKAGSMQYLSEVYKTVGPTRHDLVTNNYAIAPWNSSTSQIIGLRDDRFSTVEELKVYLAGKKFVYLMDEPEEYQLTSQEITTLLGTNNIWANTGDITVSYGAYLETIQTHADRLGDSILSAIAPLETTYTASRAYTAGSYLFVGTKFYKVTATIAEGGTITPDTNVTQTTVAE